MKSIKRLIDALSFIISYSISLFGASSDEDSKNLKLTFGQVLSLILMFVCVIYSLFAPWLVGLDPNLPVEVNPKEIKPPFESFHNLLGTDAYGRDLLDLFLLGLNKSFLAALLVVLFQIVFTIPLAIVLGYRIKKHGFLTKLFEPLVLFPAVFYYICFIAIFDHSTFIVLTSVVMATTIYTYYNHYRDVAQIMSLPMIKTLQMDGASFKHIVSLVLIPVLIPNTARLLRRVAILVITEMILISTLHISLDPLSPSWGTLVYQAWHYRDLNNYSLIVLTLLIVGVLYVCSSSFITAERYTRLQLNNRSERTRKQRAESFARMAEREF